MTLDAITHVAGMWPGSFTGIRVAWRLPRVCMAHQATGVGVSGLRAFAHAAAQWHGHNNVGVVLVTLAVGRFTKYLTLPLSPWGHFWASIQQLPH